MKHRLLLFFLAVSTLVSATRTDVTTATIATAMTNAADGDTLLLAAGTYSSTLSLKSGKVLTLKKKPGVGSAILTFQFGQSAVSNTNCGIIFEDLIIKRSSDYFCLINLSAGKTMKKLAFKGDTIYAVNRCLFRTDSVYNVDNFEITNCLITGCGSNGWGFIYPKANITNFTVRNNTLIRYQSENFYRQNNTNTSNVLTFTFANNTVFKWSKASTYALCNVGSSFSASSTYTFTDNIIAEPWVSGQTPMIISTGSGTVTANKNLIINYGSYSGGTQTKTDLSGFTAADLYNPAIGFQDTTWTNNAKGIPTGDFRILSTSPLATASSTGGLIGDPRWLKTVTAPSTLTTQVSPVSSGTINPSTGTYNTGDPVTVTATPAFGYAFKEWQDANNANAVVSTNKIYTFTIAANTSLIAVFEAVPTYTFTLTKTGTGASWGKMTITPSATGGKYEAGTSVTMTPGNNLVSTFGQWDDATTAAKTVTINADYSISASFTANPFISAWDFNPAEPRGARDGDYYYASGNKGKLAFYAVNGSTTSWGGSTISGKTCARRYTDLADMPAKCRSFVAEIVTKGYKDILVKSKVTYDNNLVHANQLIQYSLDGTNYTDVTSINMTGKTKSTWYDLNASLPAAASNMTKIYIRWIGDVTSSYVGTVTTEITEGFYLGDVVVSGTPISTVSGDLIASTSGEMGTAANWSVSGGSFGVTGLAASAPSGTDNIVIPANTTMSNASELVCNNLDIRGALSANAALTVNGNLKVLSDANGTGTIRDNGNLTVTGTTSVQQYLTAGRNWYLSSPVSGATSSVFGASSETNFLYWYDESKGSTSPWTEITDDATSLNKMQGYVANMSADGIVTFSGTLYSGEQSISVNRTSGQTKEGFNLVGNPYASYLNWDQVTKSNLSTTLWQRTRKLDNSAYAFDTYNASGQAYISNSGKPVNGHIPPMQAFWVRVSPGFASGSITVDNTMRLHKGTQVTDLTETIEDVYLKSSGLQRSTTAAAVPSVIRLQVCSGNNSDEVLLYTNPQADNAFDAYDSPKMFTNSAAQPELFTVVENERLAINGLNQLVQGEEIPLGYSSVTGGAYSIKLSMFTGFPVNVSIFLKDRTTNQVVDLNAGEYAFQTNATTYNTNRFSLVIQSPQMPTNLADRRNNALAVSAVDDKIAISGITSTDARVTVFDITGQVVGKAKLAIGNQVLENQYQPGVYLVKIVEQGQQYNWKTILK
jgi:hypothetical protein